MILGGKDDSWTVNKDNVPVELNLLHYFRHSWHVACWGSTCPFKRIDQRAFSHVREPNDSHDDLLLRFSALGSLYSSIVLKNVKEVL